MPKGQRGCFACRQPTARVVQVTLRDVNWRHPGAGREKTIDSVQRTFCEVCGQRVYEDIVRILRRRGSDYHGCGVCGHTPCVSRIQVWTRQIGDLDPRTGLRKQTSIPGQSAVATSYCEPCSEAIYDAATDPLDGGNWNMEVAPGEGDMSGARAARAAKARTGS